MNSDPQAIPIYGGRDFYVPHFEVKVGDAPLHRDVIHDITTVSYKDSVTEIDSFEITINNWDADTRDFKYSDGGIFDPGKKVELWMGYYGQDRLRLMLTGEITSLRPTFPSGGQPTLGVSGLNVLHRLRKKQESHSYVNKTDSQIAQEIGQRLGVQMDVGQQQENPNEFLMQTNQFDILFLMERAHRMGYDLFVKEDGANGQSRPSHVYFGPSEGVLRTVYRLKYGVSLIEFTPTLTTANQVSTVTVKAWDAVHKKLIEGKATRNQLSTKGVGKAGGQDTIDKAFDEREEIIAKTPVNSKAEADALAKQTLENIAKDMIKGSAATVGLPDLRSGSVIFLEGLGQRFSGRYFVTGTTHTIGDSGYTTHFDCRREEIEG
jgi:uncharacterized protein